MIPTFPTLQHDVKIDPSIGLHRIVHRASTKEYFRLGVREAGLLELMDGSRTEDAIRAVNKFGFSEDEYDYLFSWFRAKMLLEGSGGKVVVTRKGWLQWLSWTASAERWRFTLWNPDEFLDKHRGYINALFSRPAMALYLAVIFLPIAVFIFDPQAVLQVFDWNGIKLSPVQWVCVYILLVAMNAMHEMGHAVTCKHFGGKVEKIGLKVMYLQPVVYCDVSDSWRFDGPSKKLAVAAAGIFVQLLLTCIALACWFLTGWSVLLPFAVLNTCIALFNFFPFVKLDGYWMLVHVLDEPNLQKNGFRAVGTEIRRLIGRLSASEVARPRSLRLLTFGIGNAISMPLFWALGIFGVYRILAKVSVELALVVAWVLALSVSYRLAKALLSQIRTTATTA